MKREVFDKFAGSVIKPLITQICSNNSGFDFNEATLKGVYEEYIGLKSIFRQQFMESKIDLLDRHKVAACMMLAIIKNNVITSDVDESDSTFNIDKLPRVNEMLAFHVGITMVVGYVKEASANNDEEKHIIFSADPIYPDTTHGDYATNIVRSLFYSNLTNTLNIPFLAQILFDFEYIHELRYKLNEYESNCKCNVIRTNETIEEETAH